MIAAVPPGEDGLDGDADHGPSPGAGRQARPRQAALEDPRPGGGALPQGVLEGRAVAHQPDPAGQVVQPLVGVDEQGVEGDVDVERFADALRAGGQSPVERADGGPGRGDIQNDGLLGAEVAVEGHRRDVGGFGDLLDGDGVETASGEQVQGGAPNGSTGGELLAGAPAARGAGHERDCTKARDAARTSRSPAATAATTAQTARTASMAFT